jgi:translocator protein
MLKSHKIWAVIYAGLPIALAAFLGGRVTTPNLGWHATLIKPSFNPPSWLFGPVWTVLYILMGYAIWRILTLPAETQNKRIALILFYAQLVLNALWSFAFFGMHSSLLGLVVIVPLLGLILATLLCFWRLDRIAGLLLIPYFLWVSFATVLNVSLWMLN